MKELYKKHRPKSLKGVIGQKDTLIPLNMKMEKGECPHAILFTGPSGCGKTTVARILVKMLECGDVDFIELNASDFRGIDTIRDIRRAATKAPMDGPCRIWLIDECHKLTNDAQNALLKLLEDTPSHVYFFLCTTDPQKVIRTIHTRCNEVKLNPLTDLALTKVIKRVAGREEMDVSDGVVKQIVEASEGSARKALVVLDQIGHLDTAKAQSDAISATVLDTEQAIKLARTIFAQQPSWKTIATVLTSLENQDAESIRYLILAYARKILLGGGGGAANAAVIIECFSEPFFNSKHAGLAAACWQATQAR